MEFSFAKKFRARHCLFWLFVCWLTLLLYPLSVRYACFDCNCNGIFYVLEGTAFLTSPYAHIHMHTRVQSVPGKHASKHALTHAHAHTNAFMHITLTCTSSQVNMHSCVRITHTYTSTQANTTQQTNTYLHSSGNQAKFYIFDGVL